MTLAKIYYITGNSSNKAFTIECILLTLTHIHATYSHTHMHKHYSQLSTLNESAYKDTH